jgi:hypothetical protein
VRFDAHAGLDGEFEWYALDQHGVPATPVDDLAGAVADGGPVMPDIVGAVTAVAPSSGNAATAEIVMRSILPANVRFRGMPNARWWHFENGDVAFGGIDTEPRELAKLVLIDFMLVHGNDWFTVPFMQRVGTLCRIERLLVRDVFGDTTVVDRADRGALDTGGWSLYSTAVAGVGGALADFFVLPPTAAATTSDGQPLEDVRFLRDEMANMVWAIEHTTENGVGGPWPGAERAQAERRSRMSVPPDSTAPLTYRIQTPVPVHWIPFLPVLIDPATRDIALERAATVQPGGDAIRPAGRILRPTGLADPDVYRVREEEVTRAGVRVVRLPRRTRWIDGSTHLWIARRKRAGGGEGSSGLRFDVTEAGSG